MLVGDDVTDGDFVPREGVNELERVTWSFELVAVSVASAVSVTDNVGVKDLAATFLVSSTTSMATKSIVKLDSA